MKISVVLPAHNEEDNIGKMVKGLLNKYDEDILEIIVVNDASTDNTAGVVSSLCTEYKKVKLVNRAPPPGVGRALKEGFKNLSKDAEWILTMDSDFVQNIDEVDRLIKKAKEGYDGVYGSRYMGGGHIEGYPKLKRISNRLYHFFVSNLLNIKLKDLTNNFKLIKAEILRNAEWKSNDFAINAELGIFPIIRGYKIAEVPVSWIQRTAGKSTFKVFKLMPSYSHVFLRALREKIRSFYDSVLITDKHLLQL